MKPVSDKPALDEIWRWLEDVPDPEIPVVSVVDLGIVRDIEWLNETLVVNVTPTYSGCPATSVISFEIAEAMRRRGIESVEIKSRLSPAWTTDWISDEGREKLRDYGIAPPEKDVTCAGGMVGIGKIACPSCQSKNVECVSPFGSTPCKAHYRCKDCLEPFDYFKSF